MNVAKVAADWFSTLRNALNQAAIYEDGVIVYLCCDRSLQDTLAFRLAESVAQSARSSDDSCGVLVLKPEHSQEALSSLASILSLPITDNRLKDDYTLNSFAALISRQPAVSPSND